ncbi:matrixin family metalloprotease [Flavobacterium zepuense]|uniref:Matrixin family metalloprotease n=1 Tax=Flavobacterium zepuense TaxID=2593302 RepID=A0A552V5J2_9FLAO|nr:zinc-dependent metalloprotease family protein [Flavobacterium zepuense]TRW25746.1 matrixin family metalloprotease [Flavobacterium zepuense]
MGSKLIMKPSLYLLAFAFILLSCLKEKTITKETVVGVIPYEGISAKKVQDLKNAIEEYYGVSVQILPRQDLPQSAFITIKSPRYRADSLIKIQQRAIPKGVDYILGLTDKDISVTKRNSDGSVKMPLWRYNDFGIMGLAYCPGNSCVVSGFRLKHKSKDIYFGRFKKVVIHELGHNFGLPHCSDKKCVMTDAVESIKTVDNANPALCASCKKKIQ